VSIVPHASFSAYIAAFIVAVSALTTVAGCQKSTGETAPAPSSSPPPVASHAPASTASVTAAGTGPILPPEGMQSIPEKFASEAKNRPSGTVKVEDAFAAFETAGATLREKRQHLGGPFLAAYCVGAQTGEDVHMSVCEYSNAAKANEGKAMSEKAFGSVAGRTLYANGATTLTLRVGGTSAKDRELGQKIVQAFNGLSVKK
jgi:hypothetical protein